MGLSSARATSLVFCVVGFSIYWNALDNPFQYDDHHSIEYNPHIRSLSNLPQFFVDLQTFSSREGGHMYRPFLVSSYALNYALGGQEVRWYRIGNVLIHVACSLLVWFLTSALLGRQSLSWLAGVLFLVHPAHSELINYISSRSDLMVTLFCTGGVALFLRERVVRSRSSIGWTVNTAFAAGLLSKSVAMVLPLLLYIWDSSTVGGARFQAILRRYWPMGPVAIAYLAILWFTGFIESSIAKSPRGFDFQLWTQLKALVYYLWVFVTPVNLNVEHQFSVSPSPWLTPLLAAAFIISVAIVAVKSRASTAALCGAWFVVGLLPASAVPLNILVSERRAYLASAGLLMAGAWCWEMFARRRPRPARSSAVLFCFILALLTVERNEVWATEKSLWADAVSKAPRMHRPRVNLGLAHKRGGDLDAALREVRAGLRLRRDDATVWVVLGDIELDRGGADVAEDAYRQALELNPNLAGVHHNLGNIALSRGQVDEAMGHYRRALGSNRFFAESHNNLGQAYELHGDWDRALGEYETAVRDSAFWTNTGDPVGGAWLNLARAAEYLGRRNRAQEAFANAYAALRFEPVYQRHARTALEGVVRLGGSVE